MEENHFNRNPFKIYIYEPIGNSIDRVYIVIGAVPKQIRHAIDSGAPSTVLKEYYGKDWKKKLMIGGIITGGETAAAPTALISEDDLSAALDTEITPAAEKKAVNYIYDLSIFPEDKFIDLREKIHIICDIPLYRQHIFYFSRGGVQVLYNFYTNIMHQINIMKLGDYKNELFGIPIDNDIYQNRNLIKVEAFDTFMTIGDVDNIYMVDLDSIFNNAANKLEKLLHDEYQFNILYYGFVLKYFPHIGREIFMTYIENKDEIALRYPDIFKNKKTLTNKIHIETDIINGIYSNAAKISKWEHSQSPNFITYITKVVATTNEPTALVDIRNIFSKFNVNIMTPEIRARIEHGRFYTLRKTYIADTDILFPQLAPNSIIIAISLNKKDRDQLHKIANRSSIENEMARYIYLDIRACSKIYVRAVFINDNSRNFNNIVDFISEKVNPVISKINVSQLARITKDNVVYESLNISILYKKIISAETFRQIYNKLLEYSKGEIITLNQLQGNIISFIFHKGMTEFDTESINRTISFGSGFSLTNQYDFLSNNLVKQKWNKLYAGRHVKIYNRTTDLKIDVLQVHSNEFDIFYRYLMAILWEITLHMRPIENTRAPAIDKPLKRLKEFDPNLYNLKQFGTSSAVYSKICQQPNQPIVYTEEEYKVVAPRQKKSIVPFWNFTYAKPAYYSCENKKFPHLSFKAGVHPLGYCLPCCDKGAAVKKSRRDIINSICQKNFSYSEKTNTEFSKHILSYSREIDEERFTSLPKYICALMQFAKEGHSFYIYGIPQCHIFSINISILNIMADILAAPRKKLIIDIIARLKNINKSIFYSLHGAHDHFQTSQALADAMAGIFINNQMPALDLISLDWNKLFIDLFAELYDTYFILFIDDEPDELYMFIAQKIKILFGGQKNNMAAAAAPKFVLAINQDHTKYYPIYQVGDEAFKANEQVDKKIFSFGDEIISVIMSNVSRVKTAKTHTFDLLKEYVGGNAIELKYVNKTNLCYGAIVRTGQNKHLFVPFAAVPNITDGTAISFEPMVMETIRTLEPAGALLDFMARFNQYIFGKYKNAAAPLEIKKFIRSGGDGDLIYYGITSGDLVCYFRPAKKMPPGIPIEKDKYSIDQINLSIYNDVAPAMDNRRALYNESIYNNYLYYIFVLEFVHHINKERNEQVRGALEKLITETDFNADYAKFKGQFEKIIADFSANDISILNTQLVEFSYINANKGRLIKHIQNTKYNFDNMLINRLKDLSFSQVKEELTTILKDITIVDSGIKNRSLSNIYVPCSSSVDQNYCMYGKIAFDTHEKLEQYTELLAQDIKNPLKNKYLSAEFMTRVINYFQFDILPNENIFIYEE